MSISERLKGRKSAPLAQAPKRAKDACDKGCGGIYLPVPAGIKHADGRIWGVVCYKPTCYRCGHVRRRADGAEDWYFWNGDGIPSRDELNFWVPREAVERPVFDKAGAPVLGADGKQICQYEESLKKEFVRKLLILAERKSLSGQFFTLAEIMNAK